MWRDVHVPKSPLLESVNSVTIASCAIQQLPKLLHAMSNMARRTRRQLRRKGVVLGQFVDSDNFQFPNSSHYRAEHSKRKGILKNASHPGLDRLSAFNEFWKTFSFSFVSPSKIRDIHDNFSETPTGCYYRSRNQLRLTSPQYGNTNDDLKSYFGAHCCEGKLHNGIYRAQTVQFLETFPIQLSSLESLKGILFRYLNQLEISFEEQEVLLQLQYLKILFNTPIHKLVRERPKEFLVPLPRRHARRSGGQPYPSVLATHQTIQLPALELINSSSRISVNKPSTSQNRWLNGRKLCPDDDRPFSNLFRTRTVPRGVSFITYPDSVDETSFEGTIGGRSLISWVEGTKFPQMGIDQSSEFKYKKEMGRQQMIQSRMRAARAYRRICCENWDNYVSSGMQSANKNCPRRNIQASKKKPARRNKTAQRIQSVNSSNSLFRCWFKLAQLKQSLKVVNDTATRTGPSEVATPKKSDRRKKVKSSKGQIRAFKRSERKRRFKTCMIAIAKFLTCGLLTYIMKGECRIRQRRPLRTADSRERCRTPELPPPTAAAPNVPTNEPCEKTYAELPAIRID